MSNSPLTQIRDGTSTRSPIPKAMIHKRILSVAERDPNATVGELSKSVSGARPDLVARVLEEYGDPGARGDGTERSDTAADTAQKTATAETAEASDADAGRTDTGADSETTASIAEADAEREQALSAEQYEVLAAIREHPNATQRDLADLVDVSCATINRRVNSIEGFDWDERAAFATAALDGEEPGRPDGTRNGWEPPLPGADGLSEADGFSGGESTETEDDRCPANTGGSGECLFGDVELTHKVVHACMASDRITEAEEMEILRAVIEHR
jgi:hypothetical protein